MKIAIPHPFNNISEGLAQVISSIGESQIIWDTQQPIYDLLEKTKPDIMLCNRQHLRNTVTTALKEYGVKLVNLDDFDIKPAANLAYQNVKYDPKYATDILYFSLNTTQEQSCYLQEIINRQYQIKIVGNKLPLSNYLGMCSANDVIKFMKSCKIAIVFDIWTLYTYAANKVFCLTDLENEFFPTFSTPEKLMVLLQDYSCCSADQTRNLATDRTYHHIIAYHTFFHRAHDLFNQLGYTEQADKCLTQLKLVISQIEMN